MESVVAQAEARGVRARRDRARDGVRLARDLHARARRQRRRRDPRAAPRVRRRTPTRSSSPTPRASPATRWASASRTSSRSRRWRPASCRRCRTSASPTPSSATLNLSNGGVVPGALRAAPGRRVRLADQHAAAALDAGRRRPPAQPRGARLRLPDRRPGGLDGVARGRQRRRRSRSSRSSQHRCASSTGDARGSRPAAPDARAGRHRPTPGRPPAPRAVRRAARRRCRAAEPVAAAAPAAPPAPAGEDVTARVLAIVAEQTGYPRRHAGPRPRPRGRPGHRHGQAGRGVRRRSARPTGSSATTSLKLRDYPTLNHVVGFVRRPHGRADRRADAGARRRATRSPRRRRRAGAAGG